jgi:hypothetical protein
LASCNEEYSRSSWITLRDCPQKKSSTVWSESSRPQNSKEAITVAAIYKERWQIELFFRALKQSLRVKTFVETSANALKTQLWTALIAMLVVKYLQLRSTFGWSLSILVALLRQQLFVYRDLWAWIDDPFQPPPIPERPSEQLTLQLI